MKFKCLRAHSIYILIKTLSKYYTFLQVLWFTLKSRAPSGLGPWELAKDKYGNELMGDVSISLPRFWPVKLTVKMGIPKTAVRWMADNENMEFNEVQSIDYFTKFPI